ncbi:MAG: glycosyltransferase family 4 protein [Cyclobacteriaceae bacterium]|nr:glycosyltransferase family 4 protein [Cyclobacteriaceae bacterium]
MQKKILMLLNAPYPADIRVKKETDALIKAGFEIHLLCLRKKDQSKTELFEGIHVHRIDAGKNNYQLAFWDVVMSLQFVHPKFKNKMRQIVAEEKIDRVHIHDLPLVGTALSLRNEFGFKVVADMHENYPEALRTWFAWKKNPLVRIKNSLFMNPKRWTHFENLACVQSDHVIAVVEEMRDRIIKEHSVKENKITVVTNTEDVSFVQQPVDTAVYNSLKGKFIITYSGGIGPHRGVDTAIKAMEQLKAEANIQLAIVGFGSPSVMDSLKSLVTELQLTSVHFLGYQPFSKFYGYMSLADVNVIPHQSNGHTDNTVPHKLFQGMMAGKPLLVSSSAPLKRLVERYQSGLVFRAGDPMDFAEKVLTLYKDSALCEKLGNNGKHVTLHENVNWDHDQQALINLYNTL